MLIIGVMIGYVANAVIGVLKFFSVEEDIRAYVIWGVGKFFPCIGQPDDVICDHYGGADPSFLPADKDAEPDVVG